MAGRLDGGKLLGGVAGICAAVVEPTLNFPKLIAKPIAISSNLIYNEYIKSSSLNERIKQMSTATLGYTQQFSPAKIEAIKAWAVKWNATELKPVQYRDVTLEDRNFSEGLIVTQEETEEYLDRPRTYPHTLIEYVVENASKECWKEQRAICRMS